MRPTKGDGRWVAWMVGKLLTDYPDGEESIIILLAIDLFHCFRIGKESLQDNNGFRSKFQMQEYLRLESSVRQNFNLLGKKHKHKESLDDFMAKIETEMKAEDRTRNSSVTTCTYHNIEEHDEQQQHEKELASQIADLEGKSAEQLMDIAEDDSHQEDIRSRALAIAKDKIEEIDDTQE
ncbi:hypothetical protein MYX65_03210 [Acidobacteria bacterium AH-259-L09]|nr:hypothetical protein [Acidobacteria bacterium AH-259-L09]